MIKKTFSEFSDKNYISSQSSLYDLLKGVTKTEKIIQVRDWLFIKCISNGMGLDGCLKCLIIIFLKRECYSSNSAFCHFNICIFKEPLGIGFISSMAAMAKIQTIRWKHVIVNFLFCEKLMFCHFKVESKKFKRKEKTSRKNTEN